MGFLRGDGVGGCGGDGGGKDGGGGRGCLDADVAVEHLCRVFVVCILLVLIIISLPSCFEMRFLRREFRDGGFELGDEFREVGGGGFSC